MKFLLLLLLNIIFVNMQNSLIFKKPPESSACENDELCLSGISYLSGKLGKTWA